MNTKTLAHFSTGIGNFICMTPALRAMASMDPSGQIDLCTDTEWNDSRKDGLLDMWRRLPFVQEMYVIDFQDGSPRIPKDYSTWFYAEWATHGAAWIYFHKKHPYRNQHWNYHKTGEADHYMDIARDHYGYKGETPGQMVEPAPNPVLPKEGKKLVCLCNGSFGQIAPAKKWGGFPDLAKELKGYLQDCIIAKVGRGEELSDVSVYDYDFVGKLSLTETIKVIDQCDLFITVDTGLMHAADALKKKMIVLWGGSVLKKNEPLNGTGIVIHHGLSCQPCLVKGDYMGCTSFKCLEDITVEEVMYNVRRIFNGKP